ncbi:MULTISPECIES: hypothetical protein [unclassified Thiomonas]|uniref:hypothetical protein n=1 Tax=unclassified Thiomonas TaxID=2625466 RepID=UPI0004DBCABD|nr:MULTISPECIES: hypothetical protein [unclassified Thiomonas]CDW96321.1 conserved hypothetical protein [Thiomonas sp. CB2]VDY06749.1 protein of unknown function [Thiomonas sp. Bio17B3]VDY09957.1 protein of unknown function [Thiomonas sp. Sup16B3]VDY11199.1 protein of unknown function [Thiomonas sp. Sup16B3]VDY11260.1 protein of unknown function [Thiomonas sp. Bio17B3]
MSLELDINLVNPNLHEKDFIYPRDFGAGRPNKAIFKFRHIAEWREYLLTLQIRSDRVPTIHAVAYHAALHMLLLSWVDGSVTKPAEMQALRSLEAALIGVYFQPLCKREEERRERWLKRCRGCAACVECRKFDREKFRPGLNKLLDYMVAHDELNPALHSEAKKRDRSAINIIRNGIAHGDLFNALPWGGLFDVVREIIEHAYRNYPESVEYPAYVPAAEHNNGDAGELFGHVRALW